MDVLTNNAEALRDEMLEVYPEEVAKNRSRHIVVNVPDSDRDDKVPEIEANVRTIPGIITQRGCCYAGSRRTRTPAA